MLAALLGLRVPEPLKITSVMFSPRNCFAELSPITHRTASMMLDLPQPLGPTTAQRFPGKVTVVASTKDLKPASLICFSLMQSDASFLSVRQLNSSRYLTSHFCDCITFDKRLNPAATAPHSGFAVMTSLPRRSPLLTRSAPTANASRWDSLQQYPRR